MNINIYNQQLKVGNIDVLDVSASSNLQIGDNDQVVLYSTIDTPPDSIQIGPFPTQYNGVQPDVVFRMRRKRHPLYPSLNNTAIKE